MACDRRFLLVLLFSLAMASATQAPAVFCDTVFYSTNPEPIGARNCTHVGQLRFESNVLPSFAELELLSKVWRVEQFTISGLMTTSLLPLNLRSLTHVGRMDVFNAVQLQNLTGLSKFSFVPGAPLWLGSLRLSGCPQLRATPEWASIPEPMSLTIENCPLLAQLAACDRCVRVDAVSWSPADPNVPLSFSSLDVSGGVRFSFQSHAPVLDEASWRALNWNAASPDNSIKLLNIPSLTTFLPLGAARTVAVSISNCPDFESLDFLANVTTAPLLELRQLPRLQSLQGLQRVTSMGTLSLADLPALTTAAFNPRLDVAVSLIVQRVPIHELALPHVDLVSDSISLLELANLTSIGLPSLEACHSLTIAKCPSLTTLHPLAAGVARLDVGTLSVTENSALTDVSALANVQVPAGHLVIQDNPQLCCPDAAVFSPVGLAPSDVLGCRQCFRFGAPDAHVTPASGGLFFAVPFVGPMPSDTARIRFREPSVSITLRRERLASGSEVFVGVTPPAPVGTVVGDIIVSNRPTAFNLSFSVVPTSEFLGPVAQAALSSSSLRVQQEGGIGGTSSGSDAAAQGTVITLSTGAAVLGLVFLLALFLQCCWPRHCCCGRCRFACPQPQLAALDLLKVQLSGEKQGSSSKIAIKGVPSSVGGITTLTAGFGVLFLVVAFIVQVSYDNNVSSVVLDPGVDRIGAVATQFVVNATIVPAACDPADCAASLLLAVQGFDAVGNFTCERRRFEVVPETGAAIPTEACHVTWTCPRCVITSSVAASVSVLTRDPNAWSLLLNYSVQTTSYDQKPSRVVGGFAAKPGGLYKGFPFPTVSTTATSARYQYHSEEEKEGVVVKLNSVASGTLLTQSTFGAGNRTGIVFELTPGQAVLSVRVTAKQSAIGILAQVLAIVTGIGNFAIAFVKGVFKFQAVFCTRPGKRPSYAQSGVSDAGEVALAVRDGSSVSGVARESSAEPTT